MEPSTAGFRVQLLIEYFTKWKIITDKHSTYLIDHLFLNKYAETLICLFKMTLRICMKSFFYLEIYFSPHVFSTLVGGLCEDHLVLI